MSNITLQFSNAAIMTTTTISLEPLLQAFQSSSLSEAGPSKRNDEVPLSLRLQRLWQERGDFSALNEADLREEASKDAFAITENELEHEGESKKTDEAKPEGAAGRTDTDAMTPDELWDLKVNILTGLECVLVLSRAVCLSY